AQHDLALQFQGDDKKEKGHQPVVDPVLQGPGKFESASGKPGGSLPEPEKSIRPCGVGKPDRADGAEQQNRSCSGFDTQKTSERFCKMIDRLFWQLSGAVVSCFPDSQLSNLFRVREGGNVEAS